jgi:hypothetical protein
MKRPLLIASALTLLAACQAMPTAPTAGVPVLRGRVEFPGYQVQATSGDIIAGATVSIVDSAGVACMAGVTDGTGAFTLFQSTTPFVPASGAYYTLNVTKRVTTGGVAKLLTLRSVITRGANDWNSISGATVLVNVATSAVVKFDEDNTDVGPADLMGKVSGSTISAIGTHPVSELDSYKTGLTTALTNGTDGSGPLVYLGDVTLTDQASIDALAAYDEINGSVFLQLAAGVTTVKLPHLQKVTGYLTTSESPYVNADLDNLDGLSSLASVGGLSLNYCPKLTSLAGLSHLVHIAGGLSLIGNPLLTSVHGLESLAVVEGSFNVSNNDALTSLDGFSGLTTVGSSPANITNNPALILDCFKVFPSLGNGYASYYNNNNSGTSDCAF